MNRRAMLAYLKSICPKQPGSVILTKDDIENLIRILTDGGKGSYAARLTKLEDEIAQLRRKLKVGHPGLDEALNTGNGSYKP